MARGRAGDPHRRRWLGRRWTSWYSLDDAVGEHLVPQQPGVYRLRRGGLVGLLYVGESDDLGRRLRDLRGALRAAARGKTRNTGHWAAPCIHAHLRGRKLEVSWLLERVPDDAERNGIESECIAAHRWQLGRNPDCQFESSE